MSAAEHCGGCGFSHPRTTLPVVGPFDDARLALRAMNMRRGHVAVVYTADGARFIGAGGCCRDTRELVEREGHGPFGDGCGGSIWAVDKSDAELAADAAAEEHSERLYASAYGLGL